MINVAVGVIRASSRILVCQRKKTSRYPLKWEFPGGKLENGESVPAGLRRELLEELGIDATIGPELHRQEWVYPDSGTFRVFYHWVESYSGEVRNNVFEQIRWVDIAELPRVDMLDGNRDAVSVIMKPPEHGNRTA
ncbi:MAG TPA: (deoxy)nucleoside triphosphate pyrophosphohydrolase [Bacteroidota bacterium]|nr:(deoxy)nucleoside triphosphate pyrophosphohydrolase [Bacteroidota bacterium]